MDYVNNVPTFSGWRALQPARPGREGKVVFSKELRTILWIRKLTMRFSELSPLFPVLSAETDTKQTPRALRMFARQSLICGDDGTDAGKPPNRWLPHGL